MDSERTRQYLFQFKLERYANGKLKSIVIGIGWPAVVALLLIGHNLGLVEALRPLLHLK